MPTHDNHTNKQANKQTNKTKTEIDYAASKCVYV